MAEQQLQWSDIKLTPEYFPDPVFARQQSEPKTDPETGKISQATYYSAPLAIKIKDPESGKLRQLPFFEFEGPIMKSAGGINIRRENGRVQASIWTSLNLQDKENDMLSFTGFPMDPDDWEKMPEISTEDEEGRDKVGFLTQLHMRCMSAAYKDRKSIGVDGIKNRSAFEGVFKSPLRWNTNQEGQVVEGSNPNRYWNIFLRGDPDKKGHRKAPFSIPADNKEGELTLPWSVLQDAEVTFKPLIRVKSIYAGGGKLSFQMEIMSAVVYDFVRLNSRSAQTGTIKALSADKALVTKLAEQLAAVKMALEPEERKDEPAAKPASPKAEALPAKSVGRLQVKKAAALEEATPSRSKKMSRRARKTSSEEDNGEGELD